MKGSEGPVVRVALNTPLRTSFDYLPTADGELPAAGMRVLVRFGRRTQVGVVLGSAPESAVAPERLRRVTRVLDTEPSISPGVLSFLSWASEYYHHPIGEVVMAALPTRLRSATPVRGAGETRWRVSACGAALDLDELGRAPRQRETLGVLREHGDGLGLQQLRALAGDCRRALSALAQKGLVESIEQADIRPKRTGPAKDIVLNSAQRSAVHSIEKSRGRYTCFLLNGVTGSGKTEVYLSLINSIIANAQQVLVLIPEIGLTPQMAARFRERVNGVVAVIHSALSDKERLDAWRKAKTGEADVVVGTRSAVFVPLKRPGLLVVDEEHDPSYKQQDGFKYSARDLAVARAHSLGIPVVLGSATPSLESLFNLSESKYVGLVLAERAQGARPPEVRVLDVRGQPFTNTLSTPLVEEIQRNIDAGEQTLLFINRRGYAPVMMCHACGASVDCTRCSAHLVYHNASNDLRCHHCSAVYRVAERCANCASTDLYIVGAGTQRVAEALSERFPGANIQRVDRDSTRRKGVMQQIVAEIESGDTDILVGTQMLAKGHHFPNVTLVGVLDADAGLFSADFRAGERMAQLIVQVAGRAGRSDRPGRVIIQTHHPNHPLLQALIRSGYVAFAEAALAERRESCLPPFSNLALLRAEAVDQRAVFDFLERARAVALAQRLDNVVVSSPVPAPMERRAGRFRGQLLVEASERPALHSFVRVWLAKIDRLKAARTVRWSLDIDPQDMI